MLDGCSLLVVVADAGPAVARRRVSRRVTALSPAERVRHPSLHIHISACTHSPLFHRVNVEGTRRLLSMCLDSGIRRFILTSSCSVIYNGADLHNATEDTPYPAHYIDDYTRTKMLQEQLVHEAHWEGRLHTCCIRPHGIFGPWDYTVGEMLSKAKEGRMKAVIGDGCNIVDFTYVRNVTYGHILAAQHVLDGKAKGQIYHITNAEPVQFWVFLGVVLTQLGYTAPKKHVPYVVVYVLAWVLCWLSWMVRPLVKWTPFLSPFKVALAGTHHYYNCDKARKELGYVPVVSLEDGIKQTVEFYQKTEAAAAIQKATQEDSKKEV